MKSRSGTSHKDRSEEHEEEQGWVLLLTRHSVSTATGSQPQTEHSRGQPKGESGNGEGGAENGRTFLQCKQTHLGWKKQL